MSNSDNYTIEINEQDTFEIKLNEQGPQGDRGIQGEQGIQGETGQDGFSPIATVAQTDSGATISVTDANGTTTANLTNGTDGVAATITVRSTTTGEAGTNANVTNSGTSSAAELNFVIPKGDKGDKGDPGTTNYNELENKPEFSTGLTDNNNTISVTDYNKLVKNTATGSGAFSYLGSSTSSSYSINIGDGSESTLGGIALGKNAKSNANAAIQLGTGTNTTAGMFQAYIYPLLNGNTGLIPDARISSNIARSSDIPTTASDIGALPDTTTINDLTTSEQQSAINSGATSTNIGQIATNTGDIADIESLIPNQATTSNQLADKSFVNSSIATNTANFIGTFNSVANLEAYSGTVTNNDYAFVVNSVITDNGNDWAIFNDLDAYDKSLVTNFDYAWVINGSNFDLYRYDILNQEWDLRVANTQKSSVTLNTAYNRYKATISNNVATWEWEYTLNNSSFTASQWAAINSGITSGDVTLIGTAIQPSDLATVATSGSYNDLSNKPTIPTVNDNTITIQKNGTAVESFTLNQSSNETINITVPTDTNDLSNGAGFITGINSGDVTTALGYTPYDSSNPNNYTSNVGTVTSVDNIGPDNNGNVTLTHMVTTDTTQNITGEKTFIGEKRIKFKQSTSNNRLGFTLYDDSGNEKGYLEYNPTNKVDNAPLMTLGNYTTSTDNIIQVGFRRYSSVSGANGAYNLLTPLIADAKSPFSLTTTYTNFYLPLGFKNGSTQVLTSKSGVADLSSLFPTIATSVSSSSTNAETVGAKLFYDTCGDIETLINAL